MYINTYIQSQKQSSNFFLTRRQISSDFTREKNKTNESNRNENKIIKFMHIFYIKFTVDIVSFEKGRSNQRTYILIFVVDGWSYNLCPLFSPCSLRSCIHFSPPHNSIPKLFLYDSNRKYNNVKLCFNIGKNQKISFAFCKIIFIFTVILEHIVSNKLKYQSNEI